jgi:hypothetical protein
MRWATEPIGLIGNKAFQGREIKSNEGYFFHSREKVPCIAGKNVYH